MLSGDLALLGHDHSHFRFVSELFQKSDEAGRQRVIYVIMENKILGILAAKNDHDEGGIYYNGNQNFIDSEKVMRELTQT